MWAHPRCATQPVSSGFGTFPTHTFPCCKALAMGYCRRKIRRQLEAQVLHGCPIRETLSMCVKQVRGPQLILAPVPQGTGKRPWRRP
eukprot:366055-Chlamydomonas_euryale.AAC.5